SPEWDVLAAEMRAYREQQRQTWSELDSALIGRYLAGEASPDEGKLVEAAFKEHPNLRTVAELVRDVLSECQSVPSETPVQEPAAEAARPRILPFTQQSRTRRPFWARVRERGALAAAACLLLALGVVLLGQ